MSQNLQNLQNNKRCERLHNRVAAGKPPVGGLSPTKKESFDGFVSFVIKIIGI